MNWHAQIQARVGELSIDVAIEGGSQPVVLAGPNGAGKTTILKVLAGLLRPTQGRIVVGERVLVDTEVGVNVEPEDRCVGYVPQGLALFPHLRVVDNVAFGLNARQPGATKTSDRELAEVMLDRLGCLRLAHRWPTTLSGGERQRVALARALVVEPQLLLLDEPLSTLDVASRRSMRAVLAEHLAGCGCPALIVSHDLRDIRALGASVVVVERGEVVQQGAVDELGSSPGSDFVAELLGLPAHEGVAGGANA